MSDNDNIGSRNTSTTTTRKRKYQSSPSIQNIRASLSPCSGSRSSSVNSIASPKQLPKKRSIKQSEGSLKKKRAKISQLVSNSKISSSISSPATTTTSTTTTTATHSIAVVVAPVIGNSSNNCIASLPPNASLNNKIVPLSPKPLVNNMNLPGYQEALMEMLEMNFDRDVAISALKAKGNDVEAAMVWAIQVMDTIQKAKEALNNEKVEESKMNEVDKLEAEQYNLAVEASLMEKEKLISKANENMIIFKKEGDIVKSEWFEDSLFLNATEAVHSLVQSLGKDKLSNTIREQIVSLLILEKKCIKWYGNPAMCYFKKLAKKCPIKTLASWLPVEINIIESQIFEMDFDGGSKTPKLFLEAYDIPIVVLSDEEDES